MGKITKNSKQYQENVRKQKFLNFHGVKVKIDGSWGPWQEKQYRRLQQPTNNTFSNMMLGTMAASDPAVAQASGWTNTNGNWVQKRTPESNQLASNLSEVAWMSPTHPGTFAIGMTANQAVKYGTNVYNRYKFANMPLAPVGKVTRVLRKYLPYTGHGGGKSYYLETEVNEALQDGISTIEGGIVARPKKTMELHFNPDVTMNSTTREILSRTPHPASKFVGMRIIRNVPSGTVIASSENARAIPQIIPQQPLKNRFWYYATGHTPKLETEVVNGYSTDIMDIFSRASQRGNGIITPSLTTKMKGTNIFGTSFDKYSKYFPKADKGGFVEFANMTPEQVNAWNAEMAPTTGMYIDPETRLADHLMYITK